MNRENSKSFTEYVVAGTALFVSLTSLLVYIYQAKIMKEQQYVSVWPYVEWLNYDVGAYWLAARNKGVGPAIIRKVEMRLDGKPVKDNDDLLVQLGGSSIKSLVNSTLEGRVLSPGEEVLPMKIADPQDAKEFLLKLRKHEFEMRITYASVYGECWESTGVKVRKVSCPD